MFLEMQQVYIDWVVETADPRSATWPLMSSPWAMLSISAGYVWLVKQAPILLKDMKPINLRPVMVLYNLFMSLFSLYMGIEFYVTTAGQPGFNPLCNAVDYSNDPIALRVSAVGWWYFISKILEISDTMFIILKKKDGQLSFLHIYHHCTVIPFAWAHVRYFPGGTSYFMGVLNCGVHVVMYFYYFLAACGPIMHRFLGWKRLVTVLQMVQFVAAMVHTTVTLFVPNCDFPMGWRFFLWGYCLVLLILFVDFYRKAYMSKRSRVMSQKKQDDNNTNNITFQNGITNGVKKIN